MTDDEIRALLDAATPGPWVHDPNEARKFHVYSDDATGSIIATATGFQYAPRPDAEKLANARLIAAAPALANAALEALADYRRESDHHDATASELKALRDRLAVVEAERDARNADVGRLRANIRAQGYLEEVGAASSSHAKQLRHLSRIIARQRQQLAALQSTTPAQTRGHPFCGEVCGTPTKEEKSDE